MSNGNVDTQLPGLFDQIGGIRDKVSGINHLGSGGLDLGHVGGKISQKHLVVLLTDDLSIGIIFFQTILETITKNVTEKVILTEDVKLLFLFPDLSIIIGHRPSDLPGGPASH